MEPEFEADKLRLVCVAHQKDLVLKDHLACCPECGPILENPIALMWEDLAIMDSSTWHPKARRPSHWRPGHDRM